MRILAIISGEYGKRHVDNINTRGPQDWKVETWQAPKVLPPIIDYPEDHLPETLPPVDLVLSFAEHKGVAELLPEIVKRTGAKSVLVAVDDESWLPRGLDRQLRGWLEDLGATCVTPKPLCSLTEHEYGVTRHETKSYQDPHIQAFARRFGRPELKLHLDPETKTITDAEVVRDTVCGCAHHVADGLIGVSADEAEGKAGLLHHHYPCLASMKKLPHFNHDTLMHTSGQILKNNVAKQVKPYKTIRYFEPGKLSD